MKIALTRPHTGRGQPELGEDDPLLPTGLQFLLHGQGHLQREGVHGVHQKLSDSLIDALARQVLALSVEDLVRVFAATPLAPFHFYQAG
jgi:hypothetical protein